MKPSYEQILWARRVLAEHADRARCVQCPPPEPAAPRCFRWVHARELLTLAGLAS